MQSGLSAVRQPPAALILAAGESRRFWPLSVTQHKSLFRLAGVSLLERTIGSLTKAGVQEIVIVQSPRSAYADPAKAVLPSDCLPPEYGDSRLTFVEQPTPAGQGDAILRSAHLLGDSFFVVQPENINAGDIAIELLQAAAADDAADDIAVVAGQERADFSLYAVLEHQAGRLAGIREKPTSAGRPRPLCSMGIYLFHSAFTSYLADFEPDPLSIVLAIDRAAKAGQASVARSRNEFLPLKFPGHLWAYARFLDLAPRTADGLGSETASGQDGRGLCIVSEDCTLGDHVSLHNAILAPGVVIGSGTEIANGTQWNDLDAVVIGPGAIIGAGVSIAPRVRIGAGATIPSGLRIDADVPDYKTIELAAATSLRCLI
jgi:NDP-sugar pyrophosphorylase family protein